MDARVSAAGARNPATLRDFEETELSKESVYQTVQGCEDARYTG